MSNRKRKRQEEPQAEKEDEEERYFLNPDSVSKHLYCSVCCDVFVDPQRAPCGHSFCRRCIYEWLKTSHTCPEDRRLVKEKDLHHDFILQNIIGDQMVACPHRRTGCMFVGQLGQLSSHKKSCNFNPVNMPDFLRKDTMRNISLVESDNEEKLPTPVKPSLKMRLYQADQGKRQLLCSMFEAGGDASPPAATQAKDSSKTGTSTRQHNTKSAS